MRYNSVTMKEIYWNGRTYKKGERIGDLSHSDYKILVGAKCISEMVEQNDLVETAMREPDENRAMRRPGGRR